MAVWVDILFFCAHGREWRAIRVLSRAVNVLGEGARLKVLAKVAAINEDAIRWPPVDAIRRMRWWSPWLRSQVVMAPPRAHAVALRHFMRFVEEVREHLGAHLIHPGIDGLPWLEIHGPSAPEILWCEYLQPPTDEWIWVPRATVYYECCSTVFACVSV